VRPSTYNYATFGLKKSGNTVGTLFYSPVNGNLVKLLVTKNSAYFSFDLYGF
jgi:hypothetical protein